MKYNPIFTIIFDDLSEYLTTFDKSLLKEDMLQLAYQNYIVDLGFYANGFVLYVVKDSNWATPIIKEHIEESDIVGRIDKVCKDILIS